MGWLAVIGLFVGLCLAVVALCLVVAVLAARLVYLSQDREDDQQAEHAMCVAHIADVVSNRVVAMALREKAKQWDSVEEEPNLKRLGREVYKAAGPSMPNIWLNQQADLLDPPTKENA